MNGFLKRGETMDLGEPIIEHEISPEEEPVPVEVPVEEPERETEEVPA
jgi:hypothetical protein